MNVDGGVNVDLILKMSNVDKSEMSSFMKFFCARKKINK